MGDTNDRSANFDSFSYCCPDLPARLLEIVGIDNFGRALVVVPRGNTFGLVSDLDSQIIVI